jgi:3D (Asp-Asp-Asp) domain-containing protein
MMWSKQGVLLFTWLFHLLAPALPTSAGELYDVIAQTDTSSYEVQAAAHPAAASQSIGMPTNDKTMRAYPQSSIIYENGVYGASSGTPPYVSPYASPYANGSSHATSHDASLYTSVNYGIAKTLIPSYLVDRYMQRSYQGKNDSGQSSQTRFIQTAGKIINAETSNRGEVGLNAPRTQVRYVVQKGDTLYRIAKKFNISIDLLVAENRISDPTKLQVGQRLTIPLGAPDLPAWLAGNSEISDVFYATLTAYTAGYESTGKTPSHPAYGITASGAKVKENFTIAVDPEVIPLGSLVYIEGLGIRKAEDTGSAIKGKKIDVYIPDLEEALEFGVKRNVKVYVLKNSSNTKQDVSIASANGS